MLRVSANDIDLDPTLSYSIVSGNHGNAFAINQRTGLLSVANGLDYERVATYRLNVQVFIYLFIYLFIELLS